MKLPPAFVLFAARACFTCSTVMLAGVSGLAGVTAQACAAMTQNATERTNASAAEGRMSLSFSISGR